jgi:hypothetical protein
MANYADGPADVPPSVWGRVVSRSPRSRILNRQSQATKMPAKMLRGIEILADAVTLGIRANPPVDKEPLPGARQQHSCAEEALRPRENISRSFSVIRQRCDSHSELRVRTRAGHQPSKCTPMSLGYGGR